MQYALGFDDQSMLVTARCRVDASIEIVNLNALLRVDEHAAIETLRTQMTQVDRRLGASDTIVTSDAILDANIRAAIRRGFSFSYLDYERINLLIAKWISHFANCHPKQETKYIPLSLAEGCASGNVQEFRISEWRPGIYGRYGNVELRVLESWIRSEAELYRQYKDITVNLSNENYMYNDASRRHWLSASDANFNLRKLMTNAGFYAPLIEEDGSLEVWCNLYYTAIAKSKVLFPYPGSYPNFFIVQDKIGAEGGRITYLDFPKPESFYALLAEQDILFVTPFAVGVNEIFADGRIFNLYLDMNLQPFTLRALPSFVSTYPNRPHSSWLETYRFICASIDSEYRARPFSIFFASAGCYGMPLVAYVHETYGCPAVYYGNHTNTLFGVRQACSENFLRSQRNNSNWVQSDLGLITNVSKIDGGRYIL